MSPALHPLLSSTYIAHPCLEPTALQSHTAVQCNTYRHTFQILLTVAMCYDHVQPWDLHPAAIQQKISVLKCGWGPAIWLSWLRYLPPILITSVWFPEPTPMEGRTDSLKIVFRSPHVCHDVHTHTHTLSHTHTLTHTRTHTHARTHTYFVSFDISLNGELFFTKVDISNVRKCTVYLYLQNAF